MDGPSRTSAASPLTLGPVRAATSPAERPRQSVDNASVTSSAFSTHSSSSSSSGRSHSPTSVSKLLWRRRAKSFESGRSASSSVYASSEAAEAAAALARAEAEAEAIKKKQRKVNANSYCGRHSDEFLFGGKGLGDLWRAVTNKK